MLGRDLYREYLYQRSRIVKKELELYVHIPFCVRKCAYCDFLSGPAGETEKSTYTEAPSPGDQEQKRGLQGLSCEHSISGRWDSLCIDRGGDCPDFSCSA